jgi:hypothetical protein
MERSDATQDLPKFLLDASDDPSTESRAGKDEDRHTAGKNKNISTIEAGKVRVAP